MPARLFGWNLSPSTRAVRMLASIYKLQLEYKQVSVANNEHMTDFFAALNPSRELPVFVDTDGFTLHESAAILIYLSEVQGHTPWFPSGTKTRSQIFQFLHYMHSTLTKAVAEIYEQTSRSSKGLEADEDKLAAAHVLLKSSLTRLEAMLFKHSCKYLCGERASIADVAACCELSQLLMLEWTVPEEFVLVARWLESMSGLAEYKAANSVVDDVLWKLDKARRDAEEARRLEEERLQKLADEAERQRREEEERVRAEEEARQKKLADEAEKQREEDERQLMHVEDMRMREFLGHVIPDVSEPTNATEATEGETEEGSGSGSEEGSGEYDDEDEEGSEEASVDDDGTGQPGSDGEDEEGEEESDA